MKNHRTLIVFAAILAMAAVGAIVPGECPAALYSLSPTDDAQVAHVPLYPDYANTNYGSKDYFNVNHSVYTGLTLRSFLKFDLTGIASDIAAAGGGSIVGATLHLYARSFYASAARSSSPAAGPAGRK